jgi:hypothetical protein
MESITSTLPSGRVSMASAGLVLSRRRWELKLAAQQLRKWRVLEPTSEEAPVRLRAGSRI